MHTDDSSDGSTYWWNRVTGESQWTDPHADPSTQWEENMDEKSGRKYWWNRITHESRWNDPTADETGDATDEKTPTTVEPAEHREPTSVKLEDPTIDVTARTAQTLVESGDEPRLRWWEGGTTSEARVAPGDRVSTSYEVDGVVKAFTGTVKHVDWQQQQDEATAKQEKGRSWLPDLDVSRHGKSSTPLLVIKFDT